MNSKWGNSLAIVARNVRSAWRAILSGYLGSYIQEPEGGGGPPEGYQLSAWTSSSLSSCSSTGRAPRLAPARPPDELLT